MVLLLVAGSGAARAEVVDSSSQATPLTHAAAIRSLSIKQAERGFPVALQGVVTFQSVEGGFVLQDATGPIWVIQKPGRPALLSVGEHLGVTGVTDPGGFAPIVRDASVTRLGVAALPKAEPVSYADLATTRFDCHRVTLEGVVRDIRSVAEGIGAPGSVLTVAPTGGQRVFVIVPQSLRVQSADLIDAQVSVTGVCFYAFSNRRQAFAIKVLIPEAKDLAVIKPPVPRDEVPTEPIAQLLQYSPSRNAGHSIRVAGTVTYQPDAHTIYLADDTGGIKVLLAAGQLLSPGMRITATGFVKRGDFNAILEDAVVAEEQAAAVPQRPAPRHVSVADALMHDAELITVGATLVGRTISTDSTRLTLQSGGKLFFAHLGRAMDPGQLPAEGSEVLVTGINQVSGLNPDKYQRAWLPSGFELLLASPADIVLVRNPTMSGMEAWTRAIAVASLALLLPMTFLAVRSALRVRRQRLARSLAEGEFKAVLAERNRLAREIHDTLAQGFTAVFTQLELIRRKLGPRPQEALAHVDTARGLVRQSLAEARRSIFNLRPRALEDGDLVEALTGLGRQLTADGVGFDCRIVGESRPLAPDIETDLLRIGQEAITNAVRHGKPTHIEALLEFAPGFVTLNITDDGRGFDPLQAKPASSTGGIGLASIRERTRSREGRVTVRSSERDGTQISVTIPIPAAEAPAGYAAAL